MLKRTMQAALMAAGLVIVQMLHPGTLQAAPADDPFNLKTLQSLFQAYERQQAYDYARRYLAEMEGEPYFDYYYGVSAIDTGHASEGVFALERVLLSFPDDQVARLELARGYFILEEYARARLEFEQVLAAKPPEGVVQTTQQFLDQIRLKEARYRTTTNGYISLAVGSDSNVNSGAEDGSITFVELSSSSIGQEDTFGELSASGNIVHPFAPGWTVNASLTAISRKNQDFDQFDTQTTTLQLGMSRIFKQSRYRGELLAQDYELDRGTYREMSGINLEWHYNLSQQQSLTTGLQYISLEYPELPTRDSDLATLSLTYKKAFAGSLNPVLFTSIFLGQEMAEQDDNANALADTERDIAGLRVGTILSFSNELALQLAANYQTSEFDGEQTFPLFAGIKREDDLSSADLNLLWLVNRSWRLDTRFSYTDNSSNVELYSYDRTVFSVQANYSF